MTRWLAAAALLAVGCLPESVDVAAEAPETESVATETPETEQLAPAVWLTEASPLYSLQQAWGLPLPFEPQLRVLPVAEFDAVCKVWNHGEDCSRHNAAATNPAERTILLRAEVPAEQQRALLLHELGHLVRLRANLGPDAPHHIESAECPNGREGAYVMCAWGKLVEHPTDVDFAFVLGE